MIKELVQFVRYIPDSVKAQALEPKAGLHILLGFDEDGNGNLLKWERYEKAGTVTPFIADSLNRLKYSWMINDDTNKCLSRTKDIHSVSPFCLGFKRESWKGGDYYSINKQGKEKPSFNERIDDYFSRCVELPYYTGDIVKQQSIQFKNFLKKNLDYLLLQSNVSDLKQGDYIVIYNDVDQEKYQNFYTSYLAEKLFNTSDYNIEVKGETRGTSNFYNGFNSKKPFLTHQTASFDINSRISAAEAKALSEFQVYADKRLLPNPAPIFIDQPELTQEAINLFHRSEDQQLSHREIIHELWKREKDLGNYYLLYFSGSEILDFDYVSKFRYYLNEEKDEEGLPIPWLIENITEIIEKDKSSKNAIRLNSVFDFERIVIRELFDGVLIKVFDKNGGISNNYFSEVKGNPRAAYLTLTLKYRKPIYDFIYKSSRTRIGRQQFEDICLTGILDDIRNQKSNKEYAIKTKLNIYFSLYPHFDKTNTKYIMPSKIETHKTEIARVVDEIDAHFTTDDAYAFGAGQLIYFLLSKSEAGDRTHAVLEPFLQKTNHAHFNEAIASLLLKYKHAIGFDYKRFNKLAGEVLAYQPTQGLQQLRPLLLAGYFCPNILFTKKTDPVS